MVICGRERLDGVVGWVWIVGRWRCVGAEGIERGRVKTKEVLITEEGVIMISNVAFSSIVHQFLFDSILRHAYNHAFVRNLFSLVYGIVYREVGCKAWIYGFVAFDYLKTREEEVL